MKKFLLGALLSARAHSFQHPLLRSERADEGSTSVLGDRGKTGEDERCGLRDDGGFNEDSWNYWRQYTAWQAVETTPPHSPDARPGSDRFRCCGRESNFLAAIMKQARSVMFGIGLCMAGVLVAAEPAAGEGAVLIPLGVADRGGNTGFVQGEKGGIVGVELKTGKTIWQTKAARHPLIVVGDLVLAELRQGHSVKVLGFEIGSGRKLLESETIKLPEWAMAGDASIWGHSFEAAAWVVNGELIYRWEARTYYAGGAASSPEILAVAAKHAVGLSKVHLQTGKVTELAGEKPPAPISGRDLQNGGGSFLWSSANRQLGFLFRASCGQLKP